MFRNRELFLCLLCRLQWEVAMTLDDAAPTACPFCEAEAVNYLPAQRGLLFPDAVTLDALIERLTPRRSDPASVNATIHTWRDSDVWWGSERGGGGSYNVTLRPEVAEAIRSSIVAGEDWHIEFVCRNDGSLLVLAKAGTIIASRWLAIVAASDLPKRRAA